jgi:hemolysin III
MAAPVVEDVVDPHRYAATDMEFTLPRWSLGKMQNPIRGFLHGSAAVAGVLGTIALLTYADTLSSRVAALIFGLAIVGLYTTSSLYHAVPWQERWKKRMQRADRSMIYVLIAGTYTPFAVIVLDSPLRWIMLALIWGIAIAGATQQALFPKVSGNVPVALATTLGWLSLLFIWPIAQRLGWVPVMWLAVGGLVYTIGMVFLVTNRPRMWPRVFSYHELFHVMTLLATAAHFLAIWRYVLPYAG